MNEKWLEYWQNHRVQIVAGLVGLSLMGVGGVQMLQESQNVEVEVVEPEGVETTVREIVVDVAGSVVSPGVYALTDQSRVADALTAAGGLSAEADRTYVARFINQAQVIEDGMKIYVPAKNEPVQAGGQEGATAAVAGTESININTATLSQLDDLWGIGAARAQQIVDNRPYGSVEELKEKAGIPENVLEKNKDRLSVY